MLHPSTLPAAAERCWLHDPVCSLTWRMCPEGTREGAWLSAEGLVVKDVSFADIVLSAASIDPSSSAPPSCRSCSVCTRPQHTEHTERTAHSDTCHVALVCWSAIAWVSLTLLQL